MVLEVTSRVYVNQRARLPNEVKAIKQKLAKVRKNARAPYYMATLKENQIDS